MSRINHKTLLDGVIYQARWILYLINVGLLMASIVYLGRFLFNTALLVCHCIGLMFGDHSDEHLMVSVVQLIEQAMTESLLVVILMGGHQIYIRRFKKTAGPEWLEHVDTVTMKVKVSLAFVGYSSARLMEDIITDEVATDQWVKHIITHLVFLFTTLLIALVWRVMNFREVNQRSEASASG